VGNFGLNVTGGSRIVLFDVGWNPAQVEQAIHRVRAPVLPSLCMYRG
jgi:SNF2 family DNA or RNA helicase